MLRVESIVAKNVKRGIPETDERHSERRDEYIFWNSNSSES